MKQIRKSLTLKEEPKGYNINSKYLLDFIKGQEANHTKDFIFENLENVKCEKHSELKELFICSETKEYEKNDIICCNCLSELNRDYDDSIKSKLYSRIIMEEKEKILQIKENKINFDIFTITKSLQIHTNNCIVSIANEFLNFNETFENKIINKIAIYKISNQEIERIKNFINTVLNEKNEVIMKNIGNNRELKVKYIQLAYFLLRFKGIKKGDFEINYKSLVENLKLLLLDIIEIRKKMNKNVEKWLELILNEFYSYSHELENINLDNDFFNRIKTQIKYTPKKILKEINYLREKVNSLNIENNSFREKADYLNKENSELKEVNKINKKNKHIYKQKHK
jgi:hypothetical protein